MRDGQRYAQYFVHQILTQRIADMRDALRETQQEIAEREASLRWDEEFYATEVLPIGPFPERQRHKHEE